MLILNNVLSRLQDGRLNNNNVARAHCSKRLFGFFFFLLRTIIDAILIRLHGARKKQLSFIHFFTRCFMVILLVMMMSEVEK